MSTTGLTTRLLNLTTCCGLIALAPLSGCSTFNGFRTASGDSSSKMKTTLAIGDKPMPVVTGEPGSSTEASEPAPSPSPRRAANAENRVSGRVYDQNGEPVGGANVRLAVNGVPGGRVSKVTTDPSGGFTLRGLRPGSDYTVIADWEGSDGPLTGRVDAKTFDTDLKISLAPLDAGTPDDSKSSRINRVSNQADVDPDEPAGSTSKGSERAVVNDEDLPPAIEAEAVQPKPASAEKGSTTRKASKWTDAGKTGSKASPSGDSEPAAPDNRSESSSPVAEDDGPNPLPPAIERGKDSASLESLAEPEALRDSSSLMTSRDPEDPLPAASASPKPTKRSNRLAKQGSGNDRVVAAKTDPDTVPGALVVVPETFAPVVIHDAEMDASPEDPAPAPAKPPVVVDRRPSDETAKAATPPRKANARLATTTKPSGKRRPTWGDVAANSAEMPPLEGEEPDDELARHKVEPAEKDETVPDWAQPAASTAEPVNEAAYKTAAADISPPRVDDQMALKDDKTVTCDYDDRHRRINDFRLPNLQGRPVRFQDIDADLILLDFWGTWCQPCLKSIPRLVDLQARNPGKKLAVVGIACEQGDFNEAAPKVAAMAARLKVNYSMLVTRNDGSCPLQEAMHIAAFPTLILVDREGNVVWRDQGATPATLARLERFLETAPDKTPTQLSRAR